ncbi:hypothetical protein H8356DRAFT_1350687 [Neocallimastix lanati (nom. inval.)]|nr:hypothetical protein H8356DRAFT_1350687 [Neocallimastix sp. JGI-2020a]
MGSPLGSVVEHQWFDPASGQITLQFYFFHTTTTKSVNAEETVRQASRASATNEDHNFELFNSIKVDSENNNNYKNRSNGENCIINSMRKEERGKRKEEREDLAKGQCLSFCLSLSLSLSVLMKGEERKEKKRKEKKEDP